MSLIFVYYINFMKYEWNGLIKLVFNLMLMYGWLDCPLSKIIFLLIYEEKFKGCITVHLNLRHLHQTLIRFTRTLLIDNEQKSKGLITVDSNIRLLTSNINNSITRQQTHTKNLCPCKFWGSRPHTPNNYGL